MQNQPTPDKAAIDAANALFTGDCQFMLSVVSLDGLPAMGAPEIALAGRSNVGKSSLINALVTRRLMAKVSNTPGRTQALNFFNLSDRVWMVDMPGYGYAEAPVKLVAEWQNLIRRYVQGRVTLKRVAVLIDSRHGIKANDAEFMTLLDKAAVPYTIVLTKIDQIKKADIPILFESTLALLKKHPAAFPHLFATSSKDMQGFDELRAHLAADL